MKTSWLLALLLQGPAVQAVQEVEPLVHEAVVGAELPQPAAGFFREHCLECHNTVKHRGRLDLESLRLDWEGKHTRETFARVAKLLEAGDMPPEEGSSHPSDDARAEMVDWLHAELAAHSVVGGTVLRRLNRVEYGNTIRDLFGIEFEVPASFPLDTTGYGFDTVGEALVISPPQLRQYIEVGSAVADELIKLKPRAAVDLRYPGAEFADPLASLLPDRQRLVNAVDELSWTARPEGFEARFDGRYRLTVRAAAFGEHAGEPALLEVRAVPGGTEADELFSSCRPLRTLELDSEVPEDHVFEVDLLEGQGLALQFASSQLRKQGTSLVHPDALRYMAREHGEFLDALIALGYEQFDSDAANYERLTAALGTPAAETSPAQRKAYRQRLAGPGMVRGFFRPVWLRVHEHGAAIDVFEVRVEGPLGPLQELSRWLPARAGRTEEVYAEDVLRPLLRSALRRPLAAEDLARYVKLALDHSAAAGDIEHGLHFAVRVLLSSPEFLYRETAEGALDDFDLAARLSYFLWSTTPPEGLLALAEQGALSDEVRLRRIVDRMLHDPRARQLAENFTGQWLWTRKVPGIMPDERLYPHWAPRMYPKLTEETERFFMALLRENLPVELFLDADFTFLNADLARIYGIPGVEGSELRRVQLEPGQHRGGVLGQAAVLMATANGVDTSPIIRGVWLLENIAGDGVGEPPDNVPALTPDSSGATTMRERIAMHRADPLCGRCHDRIDPVGFALESYDAIGGWREHYPRVVEDEHGEPFVEDGLPVLTGGEMPDGSEIADMDALRAYLLAHKGDFYRCLTEKLMVYGAGRGLNPADQAVVEAIALDVEASGGGFGDLVTAIVLSESFRTK